MFQRVLEWNQEAFIFIFVFFSNFEMNSEYFSEFYNGLRIFQQVLELTRNMCVLLFHATYTSPKQAHNL